MQTDRSEQHAGHRASPAASDDQQLSAVGRVDQDVTGSAHTDLDSDRHLTRPSPGGDDVVNEALGLLPHRADELVGRRRDIPPEGGSPEVG